LRAALLASADEVIEWAEFFAAKYWLALVTITTSGVIMQAVAP
jgi:hypothetical protein